MSSSSDDEVSLNHSTAAVFASKPTNPKRAREDEPSSSDDDEVIDDVNASVAPKRGQQKKKSEGEAAGEEDAGELKVDYSKERAIKMEEKRKKKALKAEKAAEKAAALVVKKFSKPSLVHVSNSVVPKTDSKLTFAKLGLTKPLTDAAASLGYFKPSPIQKYAIPQIMKGKDVLANAQTGTGKTAAYALPILQHLFVKYMDVENGAAPPTNSAVKVIILTPTRELATQINNNICALARFLRKESTAMYEPPAPTNPNAAKPVTINGFLDLFATTVIVGGVNTHPQIKELQQKRPTIVIATPGRLLELRKLRKAVCDWSHVEIVVLDEADRMLSMGFNPTVSAILKELPPTKQSLLFSATFNKEVRHLASTLFRDCSDATKYAEVQATPPNSTVDLIEQSYYLVSREKKDDALTFIIERNNWYQVLVFTRTKHGANSVAEMLNKRTGMTALALHGGKNQHERAVALNNFKSGKLRVLVATDVCARGIDINDLPHVINYELPSSPEDYVHRIGRTGRAGKEGFAVSIVCVDELGFLDRIQSYVAAGIKNKTTSSTGVGATVGDQTKATKIADSDDDDGEAEVEGGATTNTNKTNGKNDTNNHHHEDNDDGNEEFEAPIPLKHGLPTNLLPPQGETPQPILMGYKTLWGAQGPAPSREEMDAFRDAKMAEMQREFGGYRRNY